MTYGEFLHGWMRLMRSPHSVPYRSKTPLGPLMQQLYFSRFEECPADVWKTACEVVADWDHWPKIDEIRSAINASLPPRYHLHDNVHAMPEFLVLLEAYRGAKITAADAPMTMLEAAQHVLPLVKDHLTDYSEVGHAEHLIAVLKANKASREVREKERKRFT